MAVGDDAAELSSLSTALVELTDRVTAIAERRAGQAVDRADELATDLFEVERALREARRRLDQALANARSSEM